jgi:asparagine N-glycosylation enzyme membrane subunit Stt3
MTWWDYGYQMSSLANRTTIADNSLANSSHVARVGLAMVSTEDTALQIMRELDVSSVAASFAVVFRFAVGFRLFSKLPLESLSCIERPLCCPFGPMPIRHLS